MLRCSGLFAESLDGQRGCRRTGYDFSWEHLLSFYEKPAVAVLQTYAQKEET